MNDALGRGDFPGAATVAIGSGPTQATAEVDALDNSLADGIAETRNSLRGHVTDAARALDLLSPGALALAVLAAVLVLLGMWPRLREYR
jgi:hypothetical protein